MFIMERIDQDLIKAMKERNQEQLDTLRMVRAAFKNEEISLGQALNEEETQRVLSRLAKQRLEAMEQYRANNREEAAQKEEREKAIILAYLPEQMSDDELQALVKTVIAELAAGSADFGKVMGSVMGRVAGKADGKRVGTIVRAELQPN